MIAPPGNRSLQRLSGTNAPVVQKMDIPLDPRKSKARQLNGMALNSLYENGIPKDGDKRKILNQCQEIQVMAINNSFFISANTSDDTDNIVKLTKHKAIGLEGCAKIAAAGGNGTYILHGIGTAGSEVHAEQNLLRIVHYMINNDMIKNVNGPIEVWGTKPPCGSCRRVLSSYADALYINHGKFLIFEGLTFKNLRAERRIHETKSNDIISAENMGSREVEGIMLSKGRPGVKIEDVVFEQYDMSIFKNQKFLRDYDLFNKAAKKSPGLTMAFDEKGREITITRPQYAFEKISTVFKSHESRLNQSLKADAFRGLKAHAKEQRAIKEKKRIAEDLRAREEQKRINEENSTIIARKKIMCRLIIAAIIAALGFLLYKVNQGGDSKRLPGSEL